MIPAHGYKAYFQTASGAPDLGHPVAAFDDQGYALVLDHKHGQLVRADRLGDLHSVGYEPAPTIVPGGGWMASFVDEVSRELYSVPIVGWVMDGGPRSDPMGDPLFVTPEGGIATLGSNIMPSGEPLHVWHPDATGAAGPDGLPDGLDPDEDWSHLASIDQVERTREVIRMWTDNARTRVGLGDPEATAAKMTAPPSMSASGSCGWS